MREWWYRSGFGGSAHLVAVSRLDGRAFEDGSVEARVLVEAGSPCGQAAVGMALDHAAATAEECCYRCSRYAIRHGIGLPPRESDLVRVRASLLAEDLGYSTDVLLARLAAARLQLRIAR